MTLVPLAKAGFKAKVTHRDAVKRKNSLDAIHVSVPWTILRFRPGRRHQSFWIADGQLRCGVEVVAERVGDGDHPRAFRTHDCALDGRGTAECGAAARGLAGRIPRRPVAAHRTAECERSVDAAAHDGVRSEGGSAPWALSEAGGVI